MAVRGRKPKPAELRELQGNPGKRALPARRPRPAVRKRAPNAPAWLGDEAKAEWHRMSKVLMGLRVLTDTDLTALAAYCDAYGRWLEARQILNREGLVTETMLGGHKVNPAWTIANQAMTQMRAFMVEFGLTPSSRTRVRVDAPAEKSEFEKFLEARRGDGG
jgi:P27 family predicted phage terminase small subunit